MQDKGGGILAFAVPALPAERSPSPLGYWLLQTHRHCFPSPGPTTHGLTASPAPAAPCGVNTLVHLRVLP